MEEQNQENDQKPGEPQTTDKCNGPSECKDTNPASRKEILKRVSKKSADVSQKLRDKRVNLQKKVREVNGNRNLAAINDNRAELIMRTIKNGDSQQMYKVEGPVAGTKIPPTANNTPPTVPNGDLNQYTKKELQSMVGGLLELVTKLTLEDTKLQSKVNKLAANIDVFKNYSLIWSFNDNLPSTSQSAVKQENRKERSRQDSNSQKTERKKENPQGSKSNSNNGKETQTKANEEKKKPKTPGEMFVNYINMMLSDYFGDQNGGAPKVICTLENLDDLESFAQHLVQLGLGRIIEKEIRINRKNNRQSFISMCDDREGFERDGAVTLPVARRYAFDGDIVRAFVLHPHISTGQNGGDQCGKKTKSTSSPTSSPKLVGGKENSICLADDEDPLGENDISPDTDLEEVDLADATVVISENCPKAFVIKIVKQTELREVVGSISFKKTTNLNSKTYFTLKPHDMKFPMVYVPSESCDEHIKSASKDDIVGMLFLAHILEIDINGYCIGELVQPVGKVGNLEAEINAILLHNGLKNLKPYDQKFYDMYDAPMAPITEDDLKQREDLRKKCIFTIDPLTARDLDDAVSVERLGDKEYEIGVHISDVSHYLEENSELDNLVKERATSIYLVNEVIHMLPTSLCFRCSLLPGEDKFAFSVFWRWNVEKEEMSQPRFTRSVINSCAQFAYEHAQKIIDNPEETFGKDDFPEILNNFTQDDVKWRVLLLHSIAQKLKSQRYESGALSINNPKIRFSLDPVSGEPISFEAEGRKEANYLIEEFMLLANQAVAKFIYQHFPDTSILRNHPPPLQKSMRALKERLANLELDFDISNSKSVYESMQRLCSKASEPDCVEACLNTLLTKPMARARYYCSEGKSSEADFWHYALSIPIYTHFTSPIRRYPDILVHRALAASLNYCPPSKRTADELHQLAKICNEQKNNAKNAGDESIDLFFVRYIKAKESITLRAVVVDIFQHMMNVVTIETGHNFTISYKMQKVVIDTSHVPSHILISEKNSQMPPKKLQLFSSVYIRIVIRNNKTCAFLTSQRRPTCKESTKIRDTNSQNNETAPNDLRNNSTSEQEEKNATSSKKKPRPKKKSKNKDKVYALVADDVEKE
ncbi:dis3 like 3'-5' exoribonuclease 2 [Haematobia irritans]|uniref:dis3 like 3'-5' exoribonuclease 2 n=1 Tax=Haematobia irritans TaxID=7368 RepID=UPI003F4F77BB